MKLLGMLIAVLIFNQNVSCTKKKDSSQVKKLTVERKPNPGVPFPFEEYAAMCKEVLGEAPEVDCDVSTSTGLNGVALPMLGDLDANNASRFRCLTSTWVFGEAKCNETSILNRIDTVSPKNSDQKVTWVTSCRYNPEGDGLIAIVGSNMSTGETCYFNKTGLPKSRKLVSANSPSASAEYDDWQAIKKSMVCVTCHLSAPWVHSPGVMLNELHKNINRTSFPSETKHKATSAFFAAPFDSLYAKVAIPSTILPIASGERAANRGMPYKIVGLERLEKASDPEGDRVFVDGEWTPKRLIENFEPAKYCAGCHDNVPPPDSSVVRQMFGLGGDALRLPNSIGKNWHDIMFSTRLSEAKVKEFLEMDGATIKQGWVFVK